MFAECSPRTEIVGGLTIDQEGYPALKAHVHSAIHRLNILQYFDIQRLSWTIAFRVNASLFPGA